MRKSELITLFDYNYWANRKIFAAAAQAAHAQLTQPTTLSWRNVFETMIHTLAAERAWRFRCQEGVSPPTPLDPADFSDMTALLAYWHTEETAMRAFLASLPEGDADHTIRYRSREGDTLQSPLWQILVHVVNHGTQHRAEAAHFLTDLGYSPGDIDFSRYFQQ